jgi:hypothetical protein
MSNNTQSGTTSSGRSRVTARTLGIAALGGALIGAGVVYVLTGTGDEAPIRVKHGSVDFELAYKGAEWQHVSGQQQWKIRSGHRNTDGYHVLIAPTNAAACTGGVAAKGNPVQFVFSDNHTVTVRSQGKKTFVEPDQGLTRSQDKMTLSYTSGSAYISSITVGASKLCTFTAPDPGLAIAMLDY